MMIFEEAVQTIEEEVQTMVAKANQLRERLARELTMVDKEVQTMTTEQTRWRWMTSEGVPDEELDTDTEIGLSWD